jgi:hypothetical protein
LRSDGRFLVRYPVVPPGAADRLDERTGFRRTIAEHPEGGSYTRHRPSITSSATSRSEDSMTRRSI